MPSLETVWTFGRPGWIPKALWGGLLSFVPILNVLALGYLLEFTQRLRRLGEWELPNGGSKFPQPFCGRFACLSHITRLCRNPLLAGWLLSEIVDLLTFGLLGIVSYFPLAVAGFIAPFLFLSAIHTYLNDGIYNDAKQVAVFYYRQKSFGHASPFL